MRYAGTQKKAHVFAAIVDGLIDALRLVTGAFWSLHIALIEEPYDRWLEEHGETETEEPEIEQHDKLVAAYLIVEEQEKEIIKNRWGFAGLQIHKLQPAEDED